MNEVICKQAFKESSTNKLTGGLLRHTVILIIALKQTDLAVKIRLTKSNKTT